jgi:hypothetical protein
MRISVVMRVYNARQNTDPLQLGLELQGISGLLSVGFIVSVFVTVLGFLLYSWISFMQGYIEWGMRRAIGLSAGQYAHLAGDQTG